MQYIADRSIRQKYSKDEKFTPKGISSRSGRSSLLKKFQRPCSPVQKTTQPTIESHPRSQTCSTRMMHRVPSRIAPCPTSKSFTSSFTAHQDSESSSSDIFTECRRPSSSTIICDNTLSETCACGNKFSNNETSYSNNESHENDNSSNSRRICQIEFDEFDNFARNIACQLRRMDRNSANRAQTNIQKILTEIIARDTKVYPSSVPLSE